MGIDSFIKNASIGVLITDEEGGIISCNPFTEGIFGYEDDELLGQKVEILIPREKREQHIINRKNFCNNPFPREMGGALNIEGIRKDGSTVPVQICLSSYFHENQIRVVSFIIDISLRREYQTKLVKLTMELESRVGQRTRELSTTLSNLKLAHRHLEEKVKQRKMAEKHMLITLEKEKELGELKSRFVSMASHEFRTPLGGILSSASLVEIHHKVGNTDSVIKHVKSIKKSVQNLTTILEEFISTDKLDQGLVTCNRTCFSLVHLVDDIKEGLILQSSKYKNISIYHYDQNITLFQDQNMLRSILINLFSNAVKYSEDEDSEIIFESKKVGRNIVITVQDFGIGIPHEDQKYLFGCFFRAKNVHNIKGTGLGLNIVKRYLDLMKGTINFISNENEGSTFTITLPMEQHE